KAEVKQVGSQYNLVIASLSQSKLPANQMTAEGARLIHEEMGTNSRIQSKWNSVYVAEIDLHKRFIEDLDKQFGDKPEYKAKAASGDPQTVKVASSKPAAKTPSR